MTKLADSPVISSPIQIHNGGLNERNLLKCIFYHLDPEFGQLLIRKKHYVALRIFEEKIVFCRRGDEITGLDGNYSTTLHNNV